MPRRARIVLPGVAHHVTQRGTRKLQVFFCPEDYVAYLELLRERCHRYGVSIWAYCLLPNHVHLVAAPTSASALGRAIGESHHRYATRIHKRHGWTGHLWQQRFYSCPLNERHVVAAARYVLRNPVRSGLVTDPASWSWSSVRSHLGLEHSPLVDLEPLARLALDWREILETPCDADEILELRSATRLGSWPEPETPSP